MKVSSVCALTMSPGRLIHGPGSIVEWAAYLRSKWELQILLHWDLEYPRLKEVKAIVENIVSQDEVSPKVASLEEKKIRLNKLLFIWQLPLTFDRIILEIPPRYQFEVRLARF